VSGAFAAGEIVLADWRDALPKAANKLRPAVVVEAEGLFHPDYPSLLLVPLTEDARLGMPDLVVRIEPSAENGCTRPSVILATHVTATSRQRVRRTGARITAEELRQVRERMAISLGLA
jgi:mRNA-degrading endonuclease toxin of MazEF toxin-antitoxin module